MFKTTVKENLNYKGQYYYMLFCIKDRFKTVSHSLKSQYRFKIALAVLIGFQLVLTIISAWQTISSRNLTNEEYQGSATRELLPVALA